MRLLCLVLVTLGSAIAQQIPQYRVEPQDGRPPRPVTAADPFELYTYYGAGLQIGWMSGIGLSFRISSPVRWGGEINAGILKLKKTSFWCLGGEVHYRLSATSGYRTYLLAGLGYYSHTTDSKPEPIWPVRFGAGLGAEVFLVELLALGAELAITAYTNGDALQVLPLPQFGLMYYFR